MILQHNAFTRHMCSDVLLPGLFTILTGCHMHTYSGGHAGFAAHYQLSAYQYYASCKALLMTPHVCVMQLLLAPTVH